MPQYGAYFALTSGDYRIKVPAGAIKFNGDATNLNTEAYVLNFTLNVPAAAEPVEAVYTVDPENNSTVAEIREIVLTFTEYETITVAEPDLMMGSNIPTVSIGSEGMFMPSGMYMMFAAGETANTLKLYVDPQYAGGMEAFTTEGEYKIVIPEGVVTFGEAGLNKTIELNYTVEEPQPIEVTITGKVKRAVQTGTASIVLTHEEDGTAHIYSVDNETWLVTELSQEGVIARDPENVGDYLAISDIALTEDGKLVACNYIRCQFDDSSVESGYKRGTLNVYIWNDLAGAPSIWFQSKASSNSLKSDQGYTMAVKGTSTNANVLVSGVHNSQRGVRMSRFNVIDGQFVDTQDGAGALPYYYYIGSNFKGASAGVDAAVYNEAAHGVNIQFNASPLVDTAWIFDAELVEPSEFLDKGTNGAEVVVNANIAEGTFGKKYNGAYYLTINDQVLMAAPYANEAGLLAGVKVLDITNGFAEAVELSVKADLEEAVEATSAAVTIVADAEGVMTAYLFADSKLYVLAVEAVEELLPMEVEFENIAAIYEMGMWDMAYYENYDNYNVVALLKSQPTVVDKVVTSGMMGGNMNNYYLNDGTGVIVLQAEGDRYEPITDENWDVIGWDTIAGLNIEVGKKLPVDFMANIDFKVVTDEETWLPTGEVYGAPVMTFVPKATGDIIVDETGWETIVTESNEEFVARCEASDFVEVAVEANLDDVLANRIDYAGKLLVLDTTANYYAAVNPWMGSMSAYMYWDASDAFDVEVSEEEGETYVTVLPKYTEDNNNFVGKLFNVIGEELPEAAFDAAATINVVNARFDWNSIAQCQTLLLKEGYEVVIPESPKDNVENNDLEVNIYSNNGSVYVETEAGAMIEVYTVNGLRVYAGVSNTTTTIINGLNTNIAIIRVNGETYKVFVK